MISVIVPVHNGEKTLRRCVDSILISTEKDIEVILVENGSTDRTLDICRLYSDKYNNVKTVVADVTGLSHARNVGMGAAKGEWISFIDADDYISDNYLELVDKCFSRSADIVFLDVQRTETTGKEGKVESMSRYSHYSKDWIIRSTLTGLLPWGGVRKIVRKERNY